MALKVFLVEDSPLIRGLLVEGLASSAGIDIVGHADSEADAIPALHDVDCDAVILDLQLRQGNGFEVLRDIRNGAARSRPVVIVFTNFAAPHFRDMSLRGGADYFFDKSRDYDRVRELLESLAFARPDAGH